ncbi:MAG: B12-binding domain-containing radical SAM protein [Candidatus Omnitrophica bacterium]|nr:B12-binding domain-containing radical SAM protein [Candidatus Omnitrophota bacterium]
MKVLLVVYDNDSYVCWFPQGLGYIASILLKEGYEVEVYNQDIHHYPDEHLTDFLNKNHFDVIAVSVIAGYYQYRKLLSLSKAINTARDRPFYMIGGHGPAPDPAHFFKKTGADVIVIGEGEDTIKELFACLGSGQSLKDVKGLAYQSDGQMVMNERRDLIKDVDSIPWPAYDLFPIDHYKLLRMPNCSSRDFVMPVLSGRGCTFKCNFCYRMDKGFRPRSNESIIDEIKYLKKEFGITYIAFSDELLMSSVSRTVSLCEAFLKADLNVKWDCNGRLNYARPDMLKVMKRSGCVFINYGIEAVDDQVLKNMNKHLTVEMIIKGIEATLKESISPGFNVIWGNLGDNLDTLNKGVEFLLKYDDSVQLRNIRPVTPYPGCELYDIAIERGLVKDIEDFYENKHVNSDLLAVNFTDLSDKEFHKALYDANKRLLNNYFDKKKASYIKQSYDLYVGGNTNFRGFRHT